MNLKRPEGQGTQEIPARTADGTLLAVSIRDLPNPPRQPDGDEAPSTHPSDEEVPYQGAARNVARGDLPDECPWEGPGTRDDRNSSFLADPARDMPRGGGSSSSNHDTTDLVFGRAMPVPPRQVVWTWPTIPAARPRVTLTAAASSSSAAPSTVRLQPKPGAMDSGFTLNKRIHARGGRGRKKDDEAKQKRADYILWRDRQDAFRRNRPDDDRDGGEGGDAVALMQTLTRLVACCWPKCLQRTSKQAACIPGQPHEKIDGEVAEQREASETVEPPDIPNDIEPGPMCAFCRRSIGPMAADCARCYAGPFHMACRRLHVEYQCPGRMVDEHQPAGPSSSCVAPSSEGAQPEPDAMDARFSDDKRIHARGGKGRKKNAVLRQKRMDYIAWRNQQDASREGRPVEDRDGKRDGGRPP